MTGNADKNEVLFYQATKRSLVLSYFVKQDFEPNLLVLNLVMKAIVLKFCMCNS